MKKIIAVVTSVLLIIIGSTTAAPAQADEIQHYQVAFTNGMGVRLRTAPYVEAPGLGANENEAIPEGYWFPVECEEYGDWVTNVFGESTNIYMRAPGGVWVSSAWLYTGVTFRTGKLPLCSELDAAREQANQPKTVADHLREGAPVIMTVNAEQTTGRAYFSKAETKTAAEALNSARDKMDLNSNLLCASIGVVTGLVTGGTTTAAAAAGAATGFAIDISCSTLTSLGADWTNIDPARGAASAAAAADKCYEVRMHKDSRGKWVADVWTVTDHHDYCA